MINTVYGATVDYSPQHDGRYIWHGFLFPLLTAYLMPRADYVSAAEVIFGYQTLALILLALALSTLRPRDTAAALSLATPILISAAWLEIGRPESLIFVFFSLGLLLFLHTRPFWHPWIAGTVLGIVAATSLVPAAFFGLFYVTRLALTKPWWRCVLEGAAVAFLALPIFAASFLIYPYTAIEWYRGTCLHASLCMVNHRLTFAGFIVGWIKDTGYPLAFFWLGLFVVVLFAYLRKIAWNCLGWRWGFAGLFVILAVLIIRTSGDERLYNIICLAPFFLFATQAMIWTLAEKWPGKARKTVSLAIVLSTLATLLPQLDLATLRFYVHRGQDREHAQALVDKIVREKPGPIDFSNSLFTLFPQPTGSGLWQKSYVGVSHLESTAPIVLIQQHSPYMPAPPTFDNYTLVENHFSNYTPSLFGLRLAHSTLGYNFAVYRRNEPPSR